MRDVLLRGGQGLLGIGLLALGEFEGLGGGFDEEALGFDGLGGFGQLGADGDERLLEHGQAVLGLLQGSLEGGQLGGVILLRDDAGSGELLTFDEASRTFLGDRGDGDARGADELLGGEMRGDGALGHPVGGGHVRRGMVHGGGRPAFDLADGGEGGAGFGHRLLGLPLPGEVTEGEDGAERTGLTVSLFGGGDVVRGDLAGGGGFLGFVGGGAQRGLGGDDAFLGLDGEELRRGGGLLQLIDLGGGLGQASAERRRVLVTVSRGGGGGDGHDGVAVLSEADDGLALGFDQLLLRLDLAHGFGFGHAKG